ncbi:hypothetical protein HDU84_007680 [Entophlyctis sp. JEL0112]|nr:hypothetical protein HDU84_007680 [Entophlyctis sp. JEL0112]
MSQRAPPQCASPPSPPSPVPGQSLARAPLLPHGSPSSTSPRHLGFALRPGALRLAEQPAPSPLAALAASVTARLVLAHHRHHQSLRSTSALVQLRRFANSVLNTDSITPSTPIIVLHALLLIHRILSCSHAGSGGGGGGGGDGANRRNFDNVDKLVPSESSVVVPSVDSYSVTHASSLSRNPGGCRHLPPSLHTPANLLLAGLLLADSFFSDLPARTAVLTAMVRSEGTVTPPHPPAGSDGLAAVVAPTQDTSRPSVHNVADDAAAAMNENSSDSASADKMHTISALDIKRDALDCLAWRVGVSEIEFAKWCTVVKRWSTTSSSAVSVLA